MPTRPTLRTRVSCRRGGCPGASLRLRVAARVRRTNPRGPDQPSLAQPWGSQPYSRSAVRRRNCAACGSAPCRFRKTPRTLPGPLNGGPGNRHPVPPWEPRPCEECCGAGGAGVQGADGAAMANIHGPESVGGQRPAHTRRNRAHSLRRLDRSFGRAAPNPLSAESTLARQARLWYSYRIKIWYMIQGLRRSSALTSVKAEDCKNFRRGRRPPDLFRRVGRSALRTLRADVETTFSVRLRSGSAGETKCCERGTLTTGLQRCARRVGKQGERAGLTGASVAHWGISVTITR